MVKCADSADVWSARVFHPTRTGQNPASSGPTARVLIETLNQKNKIDDAVAGFVLYVKPIDLEASFQRAACTTARGLPLVNSPTITDAILRSTTRRDNTDL